MLPEPVQRLLLKPGCRTSSGAPSGLFQAERFFPFKAAFDESP